MKGESLVAKGSAQDENMMLIIKALDEEEEEYL